jgi:hypothetical protein
MSFLAYGVGEATCIDPSTNPCSTIEDTVRILVVTPTRTEDLGGAQESLQNLSRSSRGGSPWTAADALARPPASPPGGREWARMVAPRAPADYGNLSQADGHLG